MQQHAGLLDSEDDKRLVNCHGLFHVPYGWRAVRDERAMQYMLSMHFIALYVLTYVICSFKRIHDCLVPVTVMPYLAGIFKHFRSKGKLPARVRAMDMRHVLLILLFTCMGCSLRRLKNITESILSCAL